MNFKIAKRDMVESQIRKRGITNKSVLDAFRKIDRHIFVKAENLAQAYDDHPLPIGEEQTISQPYISALMTELLYPTKDDIILEIGTGSGYQTAILSELSKFVVSVEIKSTLAERAKRMLRSLDIENVTIMIGDGTLGWKEKAPYDGILVTAGSPEIPYALLDQLKIGGRMVIPIGTDGNHKLQLILKEEDEIVVKEIVDCSFVPLIGRGI
ncbi:MAG: protein-L-isoaspartate(D-aspartate) O-methyltransferase [Candidatus Delongbacteria bacterium]|nr:protein-L-isoaspartate(D-aspartate) O-methyltransferase [Candidatus Delongbacteria bacterium]MBN2834425.1 protein-L-isoaspartate(D-aspartate) O-methyltransferase [Candidatus Delongbacteria bacterium]